MKSDGGIWRHGPAWAKPLVAAAPWVTLVLLVAQLSLVSHRATVAPGLSFELPEGAAKDSMPAALAAIVAPVPGEDGRTLVFFDDARYVLPDAASESAFAANLAERVSGAADKSMLLLADKRVSSGDLMKLAGMARRAGVSRLSIAEKRD